MAGVGHVGVDLDITQVRTSLHNILEIVASGKTSGQNIHDRGHGKFVGAAWGPG